MSVVDFSTCLVQYRASAGQVVLSMSYNGSDLLEFQSRILTIVQANRLFDPQRSFLFPALQPFTEAGSKVLPISLSPSAIGV